MFTLKRLVLVGFVCVGLSVAGSPAGAVDSTDLVTSSTTTVEGSAVAGIQSAGMASRAPGARHGKKSSDHRAGAKGSPRAKRFRAR